MRLEELFALPEALTRRGMLGGLGGLATAGLARRAFGAAASDSMVVVMLRKHPDDEPYMTLRGQFQPNQTMVPATLELAGQQYPCKMRAFEKNNGLWFHGTIKIPKPGNAAIPYTVMKFDCWIKIGQPRTTFEISGLFPTQNLSYYVETKLPPAWTEAANTSKPETAGQQR